MNKGENEFEDLFKESFDDFEADVNPSVWKNIQTGLKGAGIGVLIQTIYNKIGSTTLVAAVSSVSAVIATVLVMNFTAKPKVVAVPAKEDRTVVKPDKASVKEIKKFLSDAKGENKPATAVVEEVKSEEAIKKDKKKIQSVIKSLAEQPIASISASPVAGTVPLIVNLSNTGTGKVNKWSFGDKKKTEVGNEPVHVFETPGVYTIMLTSTNADGSIATDSIRVEATGNSSLSGIPASFSPNADGKDDEFAFLGKNMVSMEVMVFDKKGRIMYKWKGVDSKWDGKTQQGKLAQEGIYYYIINAEGTDGKKYEQKGSIKLIR
ncbi:MAG TPA: gliding motility-associated C-terminal domain-containing protein [Bacteroidia bacterium]|jgi:gliding motility-associated-like protein|nr:gliding motility-associated C-terminal domain-containing protein [Bacteroidia bacterium]